MRLSKIWAPDRQQIVAPRRLSLCQDALSIFNIDKHSEDCIILQALAEKEAKVNAADQQAHLRHVELPVGRMRGQQRHLRCIFGDAHDQGVRNAAASFVTRLQAFTAKSASRIRSGWCATSGRGRPKAAIRPMAARARQARPARKQLLARMKRTRVTA